MIYHFREITPIRTYRLPLADSFFQLGWLGVDLFFVLSGFILAYVYAPSFDRDLDKGSYAKFVLFRFARLYPVHFVTFAFMMALFLVQLGMGAPSHPERYTLLMVATTLTMTHAWITGIITPNMPAWSISAELFAYLLFPMLCLTLHRIRGAWIAFLCIGLALSVILDIYAEGELGWLSLALVRVTAGFLVGMSAYRLQHHVDATRLPSMLSSLLLVMIGCWVCYAKGTPLGAGILLFAGLIVSLTNPRDFVGRILSNRALVYLGEISFGMYMLHWIVRVVCREMLERAGLIDRVPPLSIIIGYSVLTIITAMVMHRYIEVPGRSIIRHWAERSSARIGMLRNATRMNPTSRGR